MIAVIDTDNCLFRSLPPMAVTVTRQVLLLISTIGFFIVQCIFAPFLDPVNNASEWMSRLNYVMTSATALAIALDIPGKQIIGTYVLYRYISRICSITTTDNDCYQYLCYNIWAEFLSVFLL